MTSATPARIGPVKTCPRCKQVLDGGPVLYYCAHCRRAVWAADLEEEFTARRAA